MGRTLPSDRILGYTFRDPDLLKRALTPPSSGLSTHNQRLEFLGDAILSLCVSQLLFREQPTWDEGALSKLKGMLVSTDALADWAQDLDLQLSRGPRSQRRSPTQLSRKAMADAMEALLAAIYLDAHQAGSAQAIDTVVRIVEARFLHQVREARIGVWEALDTKTTLQERAARLGLSAPTYEELERSGPDHAPRFRVRVSLGECAAEGAAGSLKKAQAEAARRMLEQLSDPPA